MLFDSSILLLNLPPKNKQLRSHNIYKLKKHSKKHYNFQNEFNKGKKHLFIYVDGFKTLSMIFPLKRLFHEDI